ncbi:hypothetical protein BLNAU_14231 [Blattamonas nauphoetae]|uniref:Uncharacterized protein n=1 Tax=Blattamonas nauphoetae TaxID=2049346 RepID=A0ABQ9XEB2_9EUKA|nr:hypothetical protein BLNAU_14231 [Blattamonas nauphoetae]
MTLFSRFITQLVLPAEQSLELILIGIARLTCGLVDNRGTHLQATLGEFFFNVIGRYPVAIPYLMDAHFGHFFVTGIVNSKSNLTKHLFLNRSVSALKEEDSRAERDGARIWEDLLEHGLVDVVESLVDRGIVLIWSSVHELLNKNVRCNISS